jgi:Na+-transporting methylmalonyl-CoA/oxaloacetate decarboxylase gamma subunit
MSAQYSLFCAETAGLGIDWTVLGIVLLGVAGLMVLIRVVGLFAASQIAERPAKPVATPKPAPKVASSTAAGEITPELVAVLTAAATATLGRAVRISAISVGKMSDQRIWSQEGRREIYLSHRIR